MSKFSQAISMWKRGIIAVALVSLFGVMAPIATVMLLLTPIIIPMYLFGFSLDFWNDEGLGIVVIAVTFLGPYFLGEKWADITDIVLRRT